MRRSDVWAPPAGQSAPPPGPASSAATLIPTTGRLSSTKRQASRILAGDCRSDSSWAPDTVSRTSSSSEEEQNNSAYYASTMPPVENYSSGTETDNNFQTTVSAGKAAYNAENLKHSQRVYQFSEGRSPPQVDCRGGSVASTRRHRAKCSTRIRTVFDEIDSTRGQQRNCDTTTRLSSSRSSESRHESEAESESLDYQSGAWLPRSAAVLGSTRKEELLSDAGKYSRQNSEHFRRSRRRLRCADLHESPPAPLSRAATANSLSCSARNRGLLPSCISPSDRVLLPQNSFFNDAPISNPSSSAVDNQRYAQLATRAIQRSHSREVLAAVEKPRRNWERSLRSFQASLRTHSPADEYEFTEATEEETDRISVEVNSHSCRGEGENNDEGCGMHMSEEEAAVGYESDSANEQLSGPLFAAGSACPRHESRVQRGSASCVFSRGDARYEPDRYDITLQKQLEMKARRRLQERRRRMIGYTFSVESGDAKDNWETGVSERLPELSCEGSRSHQQPHCAQRYVLSPVEVHSRLPSQSCNQQLKCKYSATGAAGEASPFYPFAASHREQEPSTMEELIPALRKRRARREAYLQQSSRTPAHSRRPVARSRRTSAERVRGRRGEEEAAREVSGDTGGLFHENHTDRGKGAQVCRAIGTEERHQQEASSSFDELSSDEEGRQKTEFDWENQSPLIDPGDRRETEQSNSLSAAGIIGMTNEGESRVEHSRKGARQNLSKSLVVGSASLNTTNNSPCQAITTGQRTSGAETTAEDDTMLLRVQPVLPLQHEQRRLIKQERKKSLNSQIDFPQSEAGNNSDSSSGPPSPRFGTPDASDDEEVEEDRASHFPPDVPGSNAPTLGCRPPTREFKVKNADSNSIQPGPTQTPENEGNYCDRNATEERRSGAAGDTATSPSTETGSEQPPWSQNNSNNDKLSDSPRCLLQDGLETASTLTTASPRGESSFFPASPMSSFPPPRSAEEERTRPSLDAFSLPPRPSEEKTESGSLTRAATENANESNRCHDLAFEEGLPSITTSPAASTSRISGDNVAAAGQALTTPVAALPPVPAAEEFLAPQEPSFVSVEEQQEKLERLRGAYVTKFSEMQRSPLPSRIQEEQMQEVDRAKSRSHVNNSQRRIYNPHHASVGGTEIHSPIGSSNDIPLINGGKYGGLCGRKGDNNNHNLSIADQNDGIVIEEKRAASDRKGGRGSFICLPHESQEEGHLQPVADGSVPVSRLAPSPPAAEAGVTTLSTSEDVTGIAVESVSTILTKNRAGDDASLGSNLRTGAAGGRIEKDADSSSIKQNTNRHTLEQKEQTEEKAIVIAKPAAQLQQDNRILNDESCATSPGDSDLCVPVISTNAVELKGTKGSPKEQSRHCRQSYTAANSTEEVENDTISAAACTAASKGATATATAKCISSRTREIPGAALLLDSRENQGSRGQQLHRSSKGEATRLTTAVTPPIVAIPPSVPKSHPRARASSTSITSFSPSTFREREALQRQRQRRHSLIGFGSSEPPTAAGLGRRSNSGRTLFARQRTKEKKPYLPLFEDTDSWTSAIAAAISPTLSCFSRSALQAAPKIDKEVTSSTWAALAAAAMESQQSLLLRALLTPRAFSHLDGSCLAAADDTHSSSSRNPTTSSRHPTRSCTFAVFEAKSGVCGSAANDSAHPLLAYSTQMVPRNLPRTAEPACGPKLQEANPGDDIIRSVGITASHTNFVPRVSAISFNTLLSPTTRAEDAKEGITRTFSNSKSLQTPEDVYTTARPAEPQEEAETGEARQAGTLAGTAHGDDSVAEPGSATLQASSTSSFSSELTTSFVSTLKKKDRQPQEKTSRVAVVNVDNRMEGLEAQGSRYAAEGSAAAEASPVSCVTPPSSTDLSEAQGHFAIQSPSRRTDRKSGSCSSSVAGQAFHKERKQARAMTKSAARTCAAAPAKSSRRSFSATRAEDAGMEASSAVHETSASSLTPTGGRKNEEQRMAALAAVAEYLRANEAQKKKQVFSRVAAASHHWGSPLAAHEAEAAADASAWMKQNANTLFRTYSNATPESDGIVAGEPPCCSTTAGCTDTRQSTSSSQTHKSWSGSSSPLQVSSSNRGNGSGRSSSCGTNRSSVRSSHGHARTLRPTPTEEQEEASDLLVGGTRESSPCFKEVVASGKVGKDSRKHSLLQEAQKSPEQRVTTEGDAAAATARTSGAGSRDGPTPRRASHAPECLTSSMEEPHLHSDTDISSNQEEQPSEDDAVDLRMQLRLLLAREQEQQQLLEATDGHIQRLHAEMEQLAQKNATLRQKEAQQQQVQEQQVTALAHAKLKILALQAQLPSWKGGLFRASAALSSSSALNSVSIEQQQQEDLQRLEQQVAALRRAIHSKQLLFEVTNEKLKTANQQLRAQLEDFQLQTASQAKPKAQSDAIFEGLSMQIEDVTAEASRKDDQLQHREQENVLLRAKLEELLQLLRPLKEALRGSRQQATQFQRELREIEERSALKQQRRVTASSQTEDLQSSSQTTEEDTAQPQQKNSKVGCKGETATTQETDAVGVQTEVTSAYGGISFSEREIKLARALGRQKSLMIQLRHEQQKQACSWIQQRTQLQQRVGALQARVQQLEEIQNIIMEPDMPQSLSVAHPASHICKDNSSSRQVASVPAAGVVSTAVAGTISCAADTSAAKQGAVKPEYQACFKGRSTAVIDEEDAITTGSLPIVPASPGAAASGGELHEEDELLDYVTQILSEEGESRLGAVADVLPDSALSNTIQLVMPSPVKRKKSDSNENSRLSCGSSHTRSSSNDKKESECVLRTDTMATAARGTTAADARLLRRDTLFERRISSEAGGTPSPALTNNSTAPNVDTVIHGGDAERVGVGKNTASCFPDVAGPRRVSPPALADKSSAFRACSTLENNAAESPRVVTQEEEQDSWQKRSNHMLREIDNWSGLGPWVSSPLKVCTPVQKQKILSCFDASQVWEANNLPNINSEATRIEDPLTDDTWGGTAEFGTHTSRARKKVQELRRKLRERGILS